MTPKPPEEGGIELEWSGEPHHTTKYATAGRGLVVAYVTHRPAAPINLSWAAQVNRTAIGNFATVEDAKAACQMVWEDLVARRVAAQLREME